MEGTSQKEISTGESKGTPSYRAPELLREDATYNNKVDIWALGCIQYEIICGQKAFQNDHAVFEWSTSDEVKNLPPEISIDDTSRKTITNLIHESLQRAPQARPSAKYFCATLSSFFGLAAPVQTVESPSRTVQPPPLGQLLPSSPSRKSSTGFPKRKLI